MKEAQIRGRDAENRVRQIAEELGMQVSYDPEDDYGGKTDLTVNGFPLQISCYPKSRGARRSLEKAGIVPLAAGEQVSTEAIKEFLDNLPKR